MSREWLTKWHSSLSPKARKAPPHLTSFNDAACQTSIRHPCPTINSGKRCRLETERGGEILNTTASTKVLDWFLLEGGEPFYEQDFLHNAVHLDRDLFEVRLPDFEVFIGPSTEPGPWVLDVAVLVRPAIALEVDTVEDLIADFKTALPSRYSIDVFATEDFGSESSVWLCVRLSPGEIDSEDLTKLLRGLLKHSRELQDTLG